ncbi:MAG: zinc ribbon domain-containing protein [Candidatus Methanofastidiosia archaeon]
MATCERCGEENSDYAITCRQCGNYLKDEQKIKIITILLVVGAAVFAAYWGELSFFVGGIIPGVILILIGVKVAKVDFTSWLKLFQAAAVFSFLGVLSTKINLFSIVFIVALPVIIKFIYNTTWKKAIIAFLVVIGVVVILLVVAVVLAVIVYQWASQFPDISFLNEVVL